LTAFHIKTESQKKKKEKEEVIVKLCTSYPSWGEQAPPPYTPTTMMSATPRAQKQWSSHDGLKPPHVYVLYFWVSCHTVRQMKRNPGYWWSSLWRGWGKKEFHSGFLSPKQYLCFITNVKFDNKTIWWGLKGKKHVGKVKSVEFSHN
jgi:hypothetical protein